MTVVFADLGGSTGFGERTDAELAREVMASYHAILQSVIDAHGGTVAKFMGDGMMALFGIPEVAEDDALRAVRAGAEIQRRFGAFAHEVHARHGETLTMRVGVNTGEVVIARGDADLVGDALNVAARLEKACRPGHVLVGEDTWRLTRAEFGYEQLGEVAVAGRDQPVSVYELALEVTSAAEPVAPFVGREAEMYRLRAVFDDATTARSAHLASVLGSPGVGKTRLSRELCAHVRAEADAVTFEVRCDRAGDATFAPIATMIREAAELGDDADGATARSHVGRLLPPSDADREKLIEVLAGLVGAARVRSVEETFWAIRRLIESMAAVRPLLVVIDDIQWAEPLLLDLLEHLTEWIRDAPVLLVCLARPELRELRPAFAEIGRRVSDVLALDGLSSAATEQLAAGLLGTDRLPAGLIERLPASTDGNPLFVRELVRMLVDDEVIRPRDGRWELTIDADAVEVPPTIQSLLAARVERLPNDERELLELASVIGAEFSLGALRELAGSGASIEARLEGMRRKELVEPTGTYWGDEPVHRFHHVLIRDAAYRRLLKTTRAELHERVGVWTDRTAASLIGEHEAVIAYHYEQAYRYRRELGAADDGVDDLGRRAAALLATAANRALGRDDLAAAGALARRAIQLLPAADLTARAELLLVGCECTLASGNVTEGAPLVAQLAEVARGDAGLEAWADCFEAQLVGLTDPEGLLGAESRATGAAEILRSLDDRAGEAKARQVRAGLLARLGRVGEAEEELQLAKEAAASVDDRRRITAVLGSAPAAALFGPSPVARAGGRCLDVVRLLRITTASPSVEATSMRCQAVLEALRGRFDVSRSMLAAARASLEELGLRHGLLETELFAGMVELIAGDPAAAIAPLRAAYGGLDAMGVGADAGQAAALLSRALLARGEIDEADQMAAASESLAGQNLKTAIAWRVARAEVIAARGDVAAGIALAEAAVGIAAATDLVIDHADACAALMGLRETAGDESGAGAARAEAVRLYDAKGASVLAKRFAGSRPPSVANPSQRVTRTEDPERTTAGTRTARTENASSRRIRDFVELVSDGRHDEAAAFVAEDHVRVDRRHTVSGPTTHGRDAIMESLRATYELGFVTMTAEPLAVRGERLQLSRFVYRTEAGFERVMLGVSEQDEAGRATFMAWHDEDDLASAIDELDERYVAGEGAQHADMIRAARALERAGRSGDFDSLQELLAPDFVVADHRQLAFGEGDRDYMLQVSRSSGDAGLIAVLDVNSKVHIVGRALLAVQHARRLTEHGSLWDWNALVIVVFDVSLRATRIEYFDLEDFDAALARLDELGAEDPRTAQADNLSSRQVRDFGELVSAGRLDEAAALVAEDNVRVDRRNTVSGPTTHGRHAIMESARAILDLGFVTMTAEPLAVRGERLHLSRVAFRTDAGFEQVMLGVGEVNAEGIGVFTAWHDEDDLASAIEELDARYIAGEGSAHADLITIFNLGLRAVESRDWDGFRQVAAPDFVAVNRRELGWGELDIDGFVAMQSEYDDIDQSLVVKVFHISGRAMLAAIDNRAVDATGSEFAWVYHCLTVADAEGRAARIELFDEHDFATALARLDELGAASAVVPGGRTVPPVENEASRVAFAGTVIETVAVRGARLALGRSEDSTLVLCETDVDAAVISEQRFAEADILVAFDALEDRYCSGEGAEHAQVIRLGGDYLRAFHRRAWDECEALYAADAVAIDHRKLGQPLSDRASVLTMGRALVDVVPDVVQLVRTIEVRGNLILSRWESVGSTPEGNRYSWLFFMVSRFVAGLQVRTEMFDLEQYPEARTRFEQLVGESRTPGIGNEISRTVERGRQLYSAGDLDAAQGHLAHDIVRMDRRRGMSTPTLYGRAAFDENIRAALSVFGNISIEPLAVRGNRLALSRLIYSSDDGFEAPGIGLYEADENGLLSRCVVFDENDLAEAVAELEDRYCAGEGAGDEYMVRLAGDAVSAFDRRDWGALERLLSPDLHAVDHRVMSFPLSDRASFVEMQRSLVEVAPEASRLYRTLEVHGDAMLGRAETRDTSPDDHRYAWESLVALRQVAGQVIDLEIFDLDQEDAARARIDEWASESSISRVDNAVARSVQSALDGARVGANVEAAGARFAAADIERFDRRHGVAAPTARGRDAFNESVLAIFEVFGDIIAEPVAVRGERLALMRVRFAAPDGFEQVMLTLYEANAEGLQARLVTFDEDDLLGALDELEERYCQGEGAENAEVIRLSGDGIRAFALRDWVAFERLLSADLEAVDHRPMGFPLSDRASFVTLQKSLVEVAPDAVRIFRTLEVRGTAVIGRVDAQGTTVDGSRYAWEGVLVLRVVDRETVAVELFALEQAEAARARFEEWARGATN